MEHYSAILKNDRGFAVIVAITLLSICTIIGIAAMNSSVDEIDISSNDVVNKQIFSMGDSGAVIAALPLQGSEASGTWADNAYFAVTETGPNTTIKIVDGNFLQEEKDSDDADSWWNNMSKYSDSKDTVEKTGFKPNDDPFVAGADDAEPDIRINLPGRLNIEVDVDKISSRFLIGGGAEFGARSDSTGSQGTKIIYIMDCVASPASASLRNTDGTLNASVPKSEIIVGYRYVLM